MMLDRTRRKEKKNFIHINVEPDRGTREEGEQRKLYEKMMRKTRQNRTTSCYICRRSKQKTSYSLCWETKVKKS